jgi:hypothetical protein
VDPLELVSFGIKWNGAEQNRMESLITLLSLVQSENRGETELVKRNSRVKTGEKQSKWKLIFL